MLAEFITKIHDLTKTALRSPTLDYADRTHIYSDKHGCYERVGHHQRPERLEVSTIAGLVDYLRDVHAEDQREASHVFVHITDLNEMWARSEVFEGKRDDYVRARAFPFHVQSTNMMSNADMVEYLTNNFVDACDRAELIKLVANVVSGHEVETQDDGITQRVATSDGVKKYGTELKREYTLIPRGGFEGIAVPETSFSVRARTRQGDTPSFRIIANDPQGFAADYRALLRRGVVEHLEMEGVEGVPVVS